MQSKQVKAPEWEQELIGIRPWMLSHMGEGREADVVPNSGIRPEREEVKRNKTKRHARGSVCSERRRKRTAEGRKKKGTEVRVE